MRAAYSPSLSTLMTAQAGDRIGGSGSYMTPRVRLPAEYAGGVPFADQAGEPASRIRPNIGLGRFVPITRPANAPTRSETRSRLRNPGT